MLPGKRSETKLNLLVEESAIEKLTRSKIFLWLIENKQYALFGLGALIALVLAIALWTTKKDARLQENYIKIQANIERMEENLFQGNNEKALSIWQETKPLINEKSSFKQAFQAKSAEILLLLEKNQEALPLMQGALKRTHHTLGEEFMPFVKITELAAAGDIKGALAAAKDAENKESGMPAMLRAYNLLQIPTLAQSLNDDKEELIAINQVFSAIEKRGELGEAVYLLSETIQSEKTSYLDYLKIRKQSLTEL